MRVGSSNWKVGGVLHNAQKIFSHPNYSHAAVDFDVAIIRSATPFNHDEDVQPIGLPRAGEPLAPGTLVYVSGWGKHAVRKTHFELFILLYQCDLIHNKPKQGLGIAYNIPYVFGNKKFLYVVGNFSIPAMKNQL